MNLRITILLVLGVLIWSDTQAQSTATFRVSATVAETCDVTVPDLARGAPPRPVLSATCTPDATYFLGLTKGLLRGAAVIQRKTVSAAQAPALTGVGTGEPVDHALFGGVPSSQVVPPVDVADTVSVRVYY